MIDQEWLGKVMLAYNVYKQEVRSDASVEDFIMWLYQQYGIILPNDISK